jgi:S-adenosylmethionine-diacylgycerolhomoserine-N-methlytransferase
MRQTGGACQYGGPLGFGLSERGPLEYLFGKRNMVSSPEQQNMDVSEQTTLGGYYRRHAHIYDLTRWAFLFGRSELVRSTARLGNPKRILEIGCGTGRNLAQLAGQFPSADITGVDLSGDMLNKARQKLSAYGSRVRLINRAYDAPLSPDAPFDLIVLSYCLSMINPGFENVLKHCAEDLSPTGYIAIADFHSSSSRWFKQWMSVNHVRMEEQISKSLASLAYEPERMRVSKAFGGLWSYLVYVGRKPPTTKVDQ